MSYATIQTAIATVVKKVTGYGTANVLEHDRRVLGVGQALAVVLWPGQFQQEDASIRDNSFIRWNTTLELYVLYDGEQESTLDTLIAEREKMIDIIHKWPHLDGTAGVLNCRIISGGEPGVVEGSQWYKQDLTVETWENQSFTVAE